MNGAELYFGDCLTEMARLESGSVDLTVTSPPYDNLRTYNGSLNDWTVEKWQAIIAELYRLTCDGGVVVWVVGDATVNGSETGTSFRQALWATECGFNLHDTMIYEKAGTGACGSNYAYWQTWEYMFVFVKDKPNSVNRIADHRNTSAGAVSTQGRLSRNGTIKDIKRRIVPEFSVRSNIWRYELRSVGWEKKRGGFNHPAMFPLRLATDHVLSWSNPGDVVFDPFLGSGTTGVACANTGRRFIGIERDPGYFAIAVDRIAKAQPDMRQAVRDLQQRIAQRMAA